MSDENTGSLTTTLIVPPAQGVSPGAAPGGGNSSSPTLTKPSAIDAALIRDYRIIKASAKAGRLGDESIGLLEKTDEELMEMGWTREELQIALDSRRAWKELPAYIRMSHERVMAVMGRKAIGEGMREQYAAAYVIPMVRVG